MCGIFFIYQTIKNKNSNYDYSKDFSSIQHRGPDFSKLTIINNKYNNIIGFHRLSIMGLEDGNQPFYSEDNNIMVICNGEIYNYEKLKNFYNFNYKTNSDCEIILHLYQYYKNQRLQSLKNKQNYLNEYIRQKKFIAHTIAKLLDGVFAFIICKTF